MNLVLWLLMGTALGWLASLLNRAPPAQSGSGASDAQARTRADLLTNIVVGVIGATVGAWLFTPMMGLGAASLQQFNLGSLAVALGGAVVLLAVVNVLRSIGAR